MALSTGLAASLLSAGLAAAGPAPLDLAALRECAARVQTLRSESPGLLRQSAALEARRQVLDGQAQALQAEAARADPDALEAQLALRQRRQQHNAEAQAFNDEIARQRQQIDALNVLKRSYERDCADRPYRRADLEALAPAAREAMRAGLDDIEVPYVDPAAR